ncbi:hypothetical protein IWQ49_006375 [Labrenzia sp. EL_126]|nr:hypothetical protein [Labrenzia sp. EL_126]
MTRITNNSEIRQMVHTASGVVQIPAGKTRDIDLSVYGRKLVDESDVLAIETPRRRKAKKQA